jgi:hypothetical protein
MVALAALAHHQPSVHLDRFDDDGSMLAVDSRPADELAFAAERYGGAP